MSSSSMFSFVSRLIETDQKSMNSLQSLQSTHSRRSSDTSENSIVSVSSEQINQLCNGYGDKDLGNAEDLYQIWGQIINQDWPNIYKKQKCFIQVSNKESMVN